MIKGVLTIKADAAGIDREFTKKALEEALPGQREIDDFADSLDAVLKKHGVEPKSTEEINLAIDGLNLFTGFPLLLATFNAEIERKKKLEKRGDA